MKKITIIILLMIIYDFARAQNIENLDPDKHVKIILKSGKIIQGTNLIKENSYIRLNIEKSGMEFNRSLPITQVDNIAISTKNYAGPGFFIGAAVGSIAYFALKTIFENIGESDSRESQVTYGYDNWGRPTVVDVEVTSTSGKNKLGAGTAIALIGGFSLYGLLYGHSMHGGWQTIYPQTDKPIILHLGSKVGFTGLCLTIKL